MPKVSPMHPQGFYQAHNIQRGIKEVGYGTTDL